MKYSGLVISLAISILGFGCESESIGLKADSSCEIDGSCKDNDQPGTDQPGTDQPGTDQPGTDQPGTDQPGTDQPGTDQPGTGQPGTDQPGTDQSGTDQPGTDQPGTDQPGTDQPGTDQPGTDQPGTDGCADSCKVNEKQCQKGAVAECQLNKETQCPEWTVIEKCEQGAYCDDKKFACAACTETCKPDALKRCSDKGVESCTSDDHGCAVWNVTEPCKAGNTCDSTTMKCVDVCGGQCNAGQVCDQGKCVCNPALPEGWPDKLIALSYPLMTPTNTVKMHGSDNIYAPDIHEVMGKRVMWYGAQGGDGHDRIFMAWSNDGAQWRKYPSDDNPQPVLEVGASNHVNDPSLVRVGNVWKMYYTDAPTGINDRIWLAESSKVIGFKKVQEVLGPGPSGAWDSDKVGRPSVLYEDGVYRMWYDGSDTKGRHVGLATSTDGIHFVKHPSNPLVRNAGAIDVDKIGGVYVMVWEGHAATYWATSVDGICWVERGVLFGLSGSSYDKYGQVTPFLEVSGGKLRGVWFGGASVSSWNRNRISAAFAPGAAPSGGGCAGCTPAGLSCSEACQRMGVGNRGACGKPGSTSAGACCVCSYDGCEKCVGSSTDCNKACASNGHAGGFCANPGSTEPGKCCACLD